MGNFKDNPRKPFEVRVPNKIRKKIDMHESDASAFRRVEFTKSLTRLEKIAALPPVPVVKKRGSLWSRFSSGVKNFMQNKPQGSLR